MRACVLDLQHGALAGLVDIVERFGDHAIQSRALESAEPVRGCVGVGGGARHVQRIGSRGEQCEQALPTFAEGQRGEILIAVAQQIEGHDHRRGLLGQQRHT